MTRAPSIRFGVARDGSEWRGWVIDRGSQRWCGDRHRDADEALGCAEEMAERVKRRRRVAAIHWQQLAEERARKEQIG